MAGPTSGTARPEVSYPFSHFDNQIRDSSSKDPKRPLAVGRKPAAQGPRIWGAPSAPVRGRLHCGPMSRRMDQATRIPVRPREGAAPLRRHRGG